MKACPICHWCQIRAKIDKFVTFSDQVSQNVLKSDLKKSQTPRYVPFEAHLTHFWWNPYCSSCPQFLLILHPYRFLSPEISKNSASHSTHQALTPDWPLTNCFAIDASGSDHLPVCWLCRSTRCRDVTMTSFWQPVVWQTSDVIVSSPPHKKTFVHDHRPSQHL